MIKGWKFCEIHAPGFSDPWYASQIGFACRTALSLKDSGGGNLHRAFAQICLVGELKADWRWRRIHKLSAVRGRKTLAAARSGADGRRDALAPGTHARLAEMEKILATPSCTGVSYAAEAAFKRGHGSSANANRALWYRHHPRNL